jgi:hypothetical protein
MFTKEMLMEYRMLMEASETLEVIERFYDDDIEQQENYDASIKGKHVLLQLEKDNIERVHSFQIQVHNLLAEAETGRVLGEMEIRFDSKKNGRKILEEAFVQRWRQGKIIYQRFYYKDFREYIG